MQVLFSNLASHLSASARGSSLQTIDEATNSVPNHPTAKTQRWGRKEQQEIHQFVSRPATAGIRDDTERQRSTGSHDSVAHLRAFIVHVSQTSWMDFLMFCHHTSTPHNFHAPLNLDWFTKRPSITRSKHLWTLATIIVWIGVTPVGVFELFLADVINKLGFHTRHLVLRSLWHRRERTACRLVPIPDRHNTT